MPQERTQTDKDFLATLARGGFAESLSASQRRDIHIHTDLDDFLEQSLRDGKQVVLTGNPGDGKTQHILMRYDEFPEEDHFYLLDASEYADYTQLLAEWNDAYEQGTPGILAINDGPLYEMTTKHSKEFPFLETVQQQLENQVIYSDEDVPKIDFHDIVVVDLNNRNVLTPGIISRAIKKLAGEFAPEGHDHSGRCHIQYNAEKLQDERIRQNLIDFLIEVGNYDEHVTVRDLLNFLCYIITAGIDACQTDFDSGLKYHTLAFEGSGAVFDLVRRRFESPELVHPFIDSRLWAEAEEEANFSDRDDASEVVEPLFLEKKQRFLFEDEIMDLGYSSRDLFQNIEYGFISHRNDLSSEGQKEQIIKMINGYFVPGSSQRSQLQLWLSHRFRSRSSLALVSRTSISKRDLTLQRPQLHPKIREAIGYTPTHTAIEYQNGTVPIRLNISKSLYKALGALDANIPYTLRDRDEEQQLLEFMEEIEYHESYSEETGDITVKDTETGRVETVDVNNTVYR
jgi:hypothetical protein